MYSFVCFTILKNLNHCDSAHIQSFNFFYSLFFVPVLYKTIIADSRFVYQNKLTASESNNNNNNNSINNKDNLQVAETALLLNDLTQDLVDVMGDTSVSLI